LAGVASPAKLQEINYFALISKKNAAQYGGVSQFPQIYLVCSEFNFPSRPFCPRHSPGLELGALFCIELFLSKARREVFKPFSPAIRSGLLIPFKSSFLLVIVDCGDRGWFRVLVFSAIGTLGSVVW